MAMEIRQIVMLSDYVEFENEYVEFAEGARRCLSNGMSQNFAERKTRQENIYVSTFMIRLKYSKPINVQAK